MTTTVPAVRDLAATPRRPSVRKKRRLSTPLTIAMLLAVAYFLLPIAWMFLSATKSDDGIHNTFGLAPSAKYFHLGANLRDLFNYDNGVFWLWLRNTFVYAIVSSGGAALLATAAGYGFSKYRFRGRNFLFAVIIGSILVPSTALALPTFLLFAKMNLTDTMWAVIIPSLLNPFGLFLMRVYSDDAVPDSLLEAARVDGASEARIFWQISFRLLAPGFVTVLLFTLVTTWNNFFLPLIMLKNQSLYPVSVGLNQLFTLTNNAGGSGGVPITPLVVTGAALGVLPLGIAFVFLQRYWTSNLGAGAVKQ
jgi:multiple sugar transport system permease protein